MQKPKQEPSQEPTVAVGLDDDSLWRRATEEEIEQGDTTKVTHLSWDENDNGSD